MFYFFRKSLAIFWPLSGGVHFFWPIQRFNPGALFERAQFHTLDLGMRFAAHVLAEESWANFLEKLSANTPQAYGALKGILSQAFAPAHPSSECLSRAHETLTRNNLSEEENHPPNPPNIERVGLFYLWLGLFAYGWSVLLTVNSVFGLFCLRWKLVWSSLLTVPPVRKLGVVFLLTVPRGQKLGLVFSAYGSPTVSKKSGAVSKSTSTVSKKRRIQTERGVLFGISGFWVGIWASRDPPQWLCLPCTCYETQ